MTPAPATTVDRDPLSRPRIASAAVAFIDEHGLASLSMRKLAAALGFEAMSLYNHVTSKDDLLDAVSDVLYTETATAYAQRASDGAWESDAFAMARAYRLVALAHPQAFTLLTDRPIRSGAGLWFLAEIRSIFLRAGFDDAGALMAFHASAAYVVGALGQEIGLIRNLRDGEGFDAKSLPPGLESLLTFREECIQVDDVDRFEWGLAVVLDGLRSRLA